MYMRCTSCISCSNAVASKIMAKMGYKSGEGLGRDNQGMSTALMVEKTSKRGGKIIHERDIPKGWPLLLCKSATKGSHVLCNFSRFYAVEAMAPPPAPVATTNLLKNPTKVVLLRVRPQLLHYYMPK